MNRPSNTMGAMLLAIMLSALASTPAFAGGLFDPDFDSDDFPASPNIDNPYWPLVPGTVFLYFADADDGCEWNIVYVTSDTKEIDGVETVVVFDAEWLDDAEDCSQSDYDLSLYPDDDPPGELTEFTYDWYAQDDDGNIWYLGEDTSSLDYDSDDCNDEVNLGDPFGMVCKDGSFEAGVDDAEAGIVMMAEPKKGKRYQQEYDEGNAEDWAKVLNFIKIEFEDDEYLECLKTREWTPLERGAIEHKYYCSGDGLLLIEGVSGGPKVWTELVDTDSYVPPTPP